MYKYSFENLLDEVSIEEKKSAALLSGNKSTKHLMSRNRLLSVAECEAHLASGKFALLLFMTSFQTTAPTPFEPLESLVGHNRFAEPMCWTKMLSTGSSSIIFML